MSTSRRSAGVVVFLNIVYRTDSKLRDLIEVSEILLEFSRSAGPRSEDKLARKEEVSRSFEYPDGDDSFFSA